MTALLLFVILVIFHYADAKSKLVNYGGPTKERFSMAGKNQYSLDFNTNAGIEIQNATLSVATIDLCQLDLEAATKKNAILEEKMQRMTDEFNIELDSLEATVKKSEKQKQTADEALSSMRKKLAETQAELDYALSSYVNFTLIQEDGVQYITGLAKRVQNRFVTKQQWRRTVSRARKAYRSEQQRLQPKMASLRRKVDMLSNEVEKMWEGANMIVLQPLVQRIATKQQLETLKEALYLSTVSAFEEISRAGIKYLDVLAKKQKERERRNQERRLEKRRRATKADRRGRRHIDKIRHDMERKMRASRVDDDDMDFTPSFLHRKVKDTLEYTLKNSAQLTNRASALLPLALSLLIVRKFWVGMLLLAMGTPASLIWIIICFVSWLRLIKGFSSLKSK
jgi:uncharacterized protein YukE